MKAPVIECPALNTALEAQAANLSLVAIRCIGEQYWDPEIGNKTAGPKQPKGRWKKYQQVPPSPATIRRWFTEGLQRGFAIICGKVSGGPIGGLEMLEFDDLEIAAAFEAAADEAGLKPVLDRIRAGYLQESPRGAPHLAYRCEHITGSTKLAQRLTDELTANGRPKTKSLIETKGEGGYFVAAPSPGTVHASGKPYIRLSGSFATIATITFAERLALLALAATFDEMPDPVPVSPKATAKTSSQATTEGLKPEDDYNQRATLETWAELLGGIGWKCTGKGENRNYWKHDDTDKDVSAVVGGTSKKNLMTVFSTSTIFKAWSANDPVTYSPFAAYTAIFHKRSFSAAASDYDGPQKLDHRLSYLAT